VEPVPLRHPGPPGLGRLRLCRQTHHLAAKLQIKLEIVRKRDAHAFEILPRRWVVERTLAWITAHRCCARGYERLPESHEAMILRAMTALMTRRLAAKAP
jgi:transposase